jgi:hypothetical protein
VNIEVLKGFIGFVFFCLWMLAVSYFFKRLHDEEMRKHYTIQIDDRIFVDIWALKIFNQRKLVSFKDIENDIIVKRYISDRKNIFGSELDKDDKYEKAHLLYENLVSDIDSEIIGFSTLFRLLSSLEDKENSQIKNTLLKILYLCGNENFNKAIICSSCEIEQLEPDGNDIELFNIGYKITKNKANSEI